MAAVVDQPLVMLLDKLLVTAIIFASQTRHARVNYRTDMFARHVKTFIIFFKSMLSHIGSRVGADKTQ
ncbi:hypothetical protein DIJ64_07265 [Mycobacterium leprae]|uniref:Uncharacterized protein n=1 Tax=Mycobacterium leprae TaxID=1769 RepID=A0AAD0KS37_MYCLR|nr:hypothetical protein [Mycobacterium leprae]AWV47940.1 hypothetical protein DIJ64_07265 [Mycobacterium leprae]OAR20090.1 hypothetical protein A8144_12255 [Mycobacterium leprae 3125609]OAX70474.1 hypothetical protein A3216_11845 [Mycobacterium leprae 7935681]